MPKGFSDHVFKLVKSLSNSEWSTYWRFYKADMNYDKPSETDAHYLVQIISKADRFDELAFRETFYSHIGEESIRRFKRAKLMAEDRLLEAIEYSPENQTTKYRLDKLPNLIQHLENRGIDFRINKFLKKYIPLAEERETYDVLTRLLISKSKLVQRTEISGSREAKLTQLSLEIGSIHSKQVEVYELLALKHHLESVWKDFRDSPGKISAEIKKLLPKISSNPQSKRAQILRLEILRRITLFERNLDEYLAILNEVIELYSLHPYLFESEENFQCFVNAIISRIVFNSMEDDFDNAEQDIELLKNSISSLNSTFKTVIESSLLHQKLFVEKERISREGIEAVCKEAKDWYQNKPYLIGGKDFLLFARLAGESLSVIENFQEAYYWLSQIVGSSPNKILPQITLPSSLWAIIVAVELDDLGLCESNLRRAKRLKKTLKSESTLYRAVVQLGELFFQGKAVDYKLLRQKIDFKSGERIINYFPFEAWFEARIISAKLTEEFPKYRTKLVND